MSLFLSVSLAFLLLGVAEDYDVICNNSFTYVLPIIWTSGRGREAITTASCMYHQVAGVGCRLQWMEWYCGILWSVSLSVYVVTKSVGGVGCRLQWMEWYCGILWSVSLSMYVVTKSVAGVGCRLQWMEGYCGILWSVSLSVYVLTKSVTGVGCRQQTSWLWDRRGGFTTSQMCWKALAS